MEELHKRMAGNTIIVETYPKDTIQLLKGFLDKYSEAHPTLGIHYETIPNGETEKIIMDITNPPFDFWPSFSNALNPKEN